RTWRGGRDEHTDRSAAGEQRPGITGAREVVGDQRHEHGGVPRSYHIPRGRAGERAALEYITTGVINSISSRRGPGGRTAVTEHVTAGESTRSPSRRGPDGGRGGRIVYCASDRAVSDCSARHIHASGPAAGGRSGRAGSSGRARSDPAEPGSGGQAF